LIQSFSSHHQPLSNPKLGENPNDNPINDRDQGSPTVQILNTMGSKRLLGETKLT
jgi:hypothetical protein